LKVDVSQASQIGKITHSPRIQLFYLLHQSQQFCVFCLSKITLSSFGDKLVVSALELGWYTLVDLHEKL